MVSWYTERKLNHNISFVKVCCLQRRIHEHHSSHYFAISHATVVSPQTALTSSHQSARQQHISCNVPASHVFCFSRQDFMQPRLLVRWSSLGLPNTLSFSPGMCRSVAVDLSFFSTETLLCGCQNRPVPCTAPGWPEALSRGCPLRPGRPCMLGSDEDGCAGVGWVQTVWFWV